MIHDDPFPAWREEKPAPEYVRDDGIVFRTGDRVRLEPNRTADILDLAMAGRTARIASIEQDFEGEFYFAVTVDDDPGRDFGEAMLPAHRFFFKPHEVQPFRESESDS